MRRTPLIAAAAALAAATTFAGTARAGLTAVNPSPPGTEPSVAALLAGFSTGGGSAAAATAAAPAAATFTRVDDATALQFADGASYQKVANHSVHDNAVSLANGQFAIANGAHGAMSDAAGAGGSDHMVAYRADGTDTYYLFFEDTPGSFADFDFNDAVVRVDASAVMVPVPPALLGGALMLGAIGARAAAKRRRRRDA
jgi:hypothetical protein